MLCYVNLIISFLTRETPPHAHTVNKPLLLSLPFIGKLMLSY